MSTDTDYAPGDRVRVTEPSTFPELIGKVGTVTRRHAVLHAYSVTFGGSAPYWIDAGELAMARSVGEAGD